MNLPTPYSKRTAHVVMATVGAWAAAGLLAHASAGVPEGAFGFGAVRGNHYRAWPVARRQFYLAGVIDGMLYAPAVGGKTAFVVALSECLTGVPAAQQTAVVDKALADNPSHWDAPMNWLVFDALSKFCGARGKPLE
ncbi:hypothetical protein GO286_04849 [Ralstonia solanacearum]|nr:hypothetical protein [Ralstonia solanacearum]